MSIRTGKLTVFFEEPFWVGIFAVSYTHLDVYKRQPGDLVFFTGTYASAGAVSHVGIYVGGSRMLHCGSVRPDRTEVEVDERRAA